MQDNTERVRETEREREREAGKKELREWTFGKIW